MKSKKKQTKKPPVSNYGLKILQRRAGLGDKDAKKELTKLIDKGLIDE